MESVVEPTMSNSSPSLFILKSIISALSPFHHHDPLTPLLPLTTLATAALFLHHSLTGLLPLIGIDPPTFSEISDFAGLLPFLIEMDTPLLVDTSKNYGDRGIARVQCRRDLDEGGINISKTMSSAMITIRSGSSVILEHHHHRIRLWSSTNISTELPEKDLAEGGFSTLVDVVGPSSSPAVEVAEPLS